MKLIVILCLLLGFVTTLPAAAEKPLALKIGNGNKAKTTLQTPVTSQTPTQTATSDAAERWQSIDRYQVNEGLVKDSVTGLMWMRCSLGQTWDEGICGGEAKTYTWHEAMITPDSFSYGGYSDWHLPSREELKTLVYCSNGKPKLWNDTGKYCDGHSIKPTINLIAFPQTLAREHWSSSPSPIAYLR